ncbi:MAG TPA: hypothetical protein VE397_06390, partial [Stellaceae bacterium]|nr:hypothetical protein [Stellaceae bacterium]
MLSPNPFRPRASAFRRIRAAALATTVGLSLAFAPTVWTWAQTPAPSAANQAALPSFAPLVKKVLPAVVNISVTEKQDASDDGDQMDDQSGP